MAEDFEDYFAVRRSHTLPRRLSGIVSELQSVSSSHLFRRWRQKEAKVSLDGLRLELVYEREDHHRQFLKGRGWIGRGMEGFRGSDGDGPQQHNVEYLYRLEMHFSQPLHGSARLDYGLNETIDPLPSFNHKYLRAQSWLGQITDEVDHLVSNL
jgi:hypothetical protein